MQKGEEMQKTLTAAIAGLALLATSTAFADTTIYKITQIDPTARTVTLASGKVYVVDMTINLNNFKVGDQVKVTYTTDATGKNLATAVAKP